MLKKEHADVAGAVNSREQELGGRRTCMSVILSRDGLEERWRVTTADERCGMSWLNFKKI